MSDVEALRPSLEDVIADLTTISTRIRVLARASYERAELLVSRVRLKSRFAL